MDILPFCARPAGPCRPCLFSPCIFLPSCNSRSFYTTGLLTSLKVALCSTHWLGRSFFTLSGFACWWFLCWCILCLTYACIVDRRLNALEELIFSHWTLGAAHFTYSLSTDSLSTDLRRLTCTQRLLRSTYVFYGGAINFFFESSSPFRVVAGVAWLVLLGRQALGVGMCQRNTGRPRVAAM